MKHKKLFALLLSIVMVFALFAMSACTAGSQNSVAAETAAASESAPAPAEPDKDTQQMGVIRSIDTAANQITISVMGINPMQHPDNDGQMQNPPEKPDGTDGNAPAKPDGNGQMQPPEKPDGNAPAKPDGDNQMQPPENGQFPGDNSTTYTVSENTVITDAEGKTISLSDLSENAFVQFTADGNTLLTISVAKDMPAPGDFDKDAAAPTSSPEA